jgi:hypothetical protein
MWADAISTLLASIPSTGIRHPFLKLLAECFALWHHNLTSSTPTKTNKASAAHSLYDLLEGYSESASGPYHYGAPTAFSVQRPSLPEDAVIHSWCVSVGLEEDELEALYALCMRKQSAAREDGTDAAIERSVRTL